MEQTDTGTIMPAVRPQFLTVLCILSFIGTGLGIIMGIYHLATVSQTQAAASMYEEMSASDNVNSMPMVENMMQGAMEMAKHAYELAGVEIVTNLLCLLGVLMMWKLRKSGYYIYTLGQLAAIISPIVLVGSVGVLGGLMLGMDIFPIVFIVLYGLNLKHMS